MIIAKEHIKGQVEKSLKYMGVDHIDTLLLHRPSPFYGSSRDQSSFRRVETRR